MDALFKLTEDWKQLLDRPRLVPFGMGRIGRRVLPSLQKEFDIPFLIDNYHAGETIAGLSVVSLADAVPRLSQDVAKIVVTTMKGSYIDIAKELVDAGFVEYRDFCIFERFAEEWHLRWKRQCVLAKIDTVITSHCTLRCKNCNMFIPYAKDVCDFSFDRLRKNFDTFFASVDFVYEYTLLGGEPFLHKDLKHILCYLTEQYGGRVTFFVVGSRVNTYRAEIQRMADDGHEIGNHSMDHKILTKLGAPEIRAQIDRCSGAVKDITGQDTALVRTPGGGVNDTVRANISQPIILWNIDTLDWKTRNADQTVQKVLSQVKDGDIVLMHEIYSQSGEAAVRIIPELARRGFQMVTVSELAKYKGITLEGGKTYSSFR